MNQNSLKFILLMAFGFFAGIVQAQQSFIVTYSVEIVTDTTIQVPDKNKVDTVVAINPATLEKSTKYVMGMKSVKNPVPTLFESEKEANQFKESIISGIESGAIKAYRGIDDKTPMSSSAIEKLFHPLDTVTAINPVTLATEAKIIKNYLYFDKIKYIEEWKMDKAGKISKRVKSYSLQKEGYDRSGKSTGYVDIITVKND